MVGWLRSVLFPPIHSVETSTRSIARQIYTLALILLASVVWMGFAFVLVAPAFAERARLLFPLACTLIIVMFLTRAGYVRAACLLLVNGLWIALLVASFASGGVRGAAFPGNIVVVLCAGFLLGRRAAIGYAIASIIAGVFLVTIEIQGLIPPPAVALLPQVALIVWSVYFFAAAGLLYLATGSISIALEDANSQLAERRQAEEKLRKSEQHLRSLITAIPDLILILGADGRYHDIVPGNEELLTAPREEILGKRFHDVLPPILAAQIQAVIDTALATGEVQEFEYAVRTKRGNTWFQARVVSYTDVGEPRLVWLARNITAYKFAEEELRESEVRYRRAITAADAVPYYHDYRLESYTFIGEAICGMTGYAPDEITPALLQSLILQSSMRGASAALSSAEASMLARAGALMEWKADFLIRTRTGSERWFADSAIQVLDEHGVPSGSIGILQDITERKHTEWALQESEERFRSLSEAAFEGLGISEQGQIIDLNTRLAEMLGYETCELIGMQILDLVAPESRELLAEHLRQGLETPFTHIALRKDGSTFPVETQAKTLPYKGRIVRVSAIRDISQRVALEEQLRQSQKLQAIGQLAGGLAHDFNNLLTIIMSYSDLLLETAQIHAPELSNDIEAIRSASGRAAALTRQLLAFSRRQMLQMEVLDLNQVIRGVVSLLERLLGEDIELQTVLEPGLSMVRADAGQLEQVIMNLFVNARDAMPRGGVLTIETSNSILDASYAQQHAEVQPGAYVMLAVSDTGVGMDEQTQAHIFEPFFTTKESGHGTGLGLATVHGIVKQCNGHIWFYSERGHGTTFKIYFPQVASSASSPSRERLQNAAAVGDETILVVEDEVAVRQLARLILEQHGYQVLEATSETAQQISQEYTGDIQLLLTDVVMPKLSGSELATYLTQARPGIKVLYMSGYTDNIIMHHGILEGSIAFLQKPFTPAILAEKVRSVLDT